MTQSPAKTKPRHFIVTLDIPVEESLYGSQAKPQWWDWTELLSERVRGQVKVLKSYPSHGKPNAGGVTA